METSRIERISSVSPVWRKDWTDVIEAYREMYRHTAEVMARRERDNPHSLGGRKATAADRPMPGDAMWKHNGELS